VVAFTSNLFALDLEVIQFVLLLIVRHRHRRGYLLPGLWPTTTDRLPRRRLRHPLPAVVADLQCTHLRTTNEALAGEVAGLLTEAGTTSPLQLTAIANRLPRMDSRPALTPVHTSPRKAATLPSSSGIPSTLSNTPHRNSLPLQTHYPLRTITRTMRPRFTNSLRTVPSSPTLPHPNPPIALDIPLLDRPLSSGALSLPQTSRRMVMAVAAVEVGDTVIVEDTKEGR